MARDITLTFEDGTTHTYQGAPDSVTPDQIEQRAARDFVGRRVTNIARQAVAGLPTPPAAAPRREVGFVESAGRTAAASTIPVVKMFGLAAATAARLFGRKAQDKVFEAMDRVTGRMEQEYRPQAGEEFSTAGQIAGGIASMPVEVAGGFGLQHGVERAQEVVQRGGSVGEAGRAGAVTGAVRVGMNALPVKVGGTVGRVVENAAGRVIGGGLTGAGLVGVTGVAGRAAENAALPEGEQFADMRQDVTPSAAELGLGAAFGAVPGALAAAKTLRGAAETPVRDLPRQVPDAEKALPGGIAKRVVQPNPTLLADVKAAEKAGLTVLPHHVAEGDAVRALGTAAGGAAYKQNTKAFTKALIKELDPEEKSVRLDTKTFHRVLDKQGKTIGESMAKYDMPVDDALRARLEAISKDAADNADADTGRMTMNRVREILGKAEAGEGQITGQAVRELDTAIGRQIRSNTKNQDLVARLRAVQDVLRDTAERQMAPDEAKAVQQARRRYAYAMEILPDIDDFGRTGYYEPGQLWKRLTGSEAGRQRVASERGGLTDLAKAGALVADRSGTGHGYVSVGSNSVGVGTSGMRAYASPNMMLKLVTGGAVGEKAYNRFGPNLVRRLAAEHDAAMARAAQAPEPPPLELAAPDAPMPQGPRPDVRGEAPAEVPEWSVTTPSRVARPGDQIPAVEPEGLLPAVGDDVPPARIIRGAGETRRVAPVARVVDPEDPGALPREEAPRKLRGPAEPAVVTAGQVAAQRAAQPPRVERTPAEIGEGARRPRVPDIPAVPGRPDMPDVMVAGGPREVAATEATGRAMQAPDAALAREQQGFAPPKPPAEGPKGGGTPPAGGGGGGTPPMDPRLAKIAELRRQAPSAAVKKVLDAREAEIKKTIKRETDISELEAAARATDDADLRQSLLAEANKLRGGKLPVGEVTEGMPELPKPKVEKIPVGKVIEGQPDLPVDKTERIPVGEATEIIPEVVEPVPERIPVGEATEMPEPLPVGEVVEDPIPVGDAMEFEQLPVGEATEITPELVVSEATNVDNAPTAPAGGGRSEGMEQTKGAERIASQDNKPWAMTREQFAKEHPQDDYDRMLNRHADLGDIPYAEADRRARTNSLGQRKLWAKTRAELTQEGKDTLKAARADRAATNKLKGTPEFGNWRIKVMSRAGNAAVADAERLYKDYLAIHKDRVQEALMEGKDVPSEVLADYPDLKRPEPQPAPTAPAGGGRSEGMEQTKGASTAETVEDRKARIRAQKPSERSREDMDWYHDQRNAEGVAAEEQAAAERAAKRKSNAELSVAERRANSVLDKPHDFGTAWGLGSGTRRDALDRAVEQGRAIVAKEVEVPGRQAADKKLVSDHDSYAFHSPGVARENSNVAAARERLKDPANYKKTEYRIYQGSEATGTFRTISKTEYDYAVKKAAAQENTRPEPRPAPTAPAGGGRSEGMEQTKGLPSHAAASAEAKRLTESTGTRHKSVPRDEIDADGYEVRVWDVLAEEKPKGMSIEEAKSYIDRANQERPFGLSWEAISAKQGGKLDVSTPRQRENTRTEPQPAPTAPAGGGRSEGMEQPVYFLGSADKYDQVSIYLKDGAFNKEQVWRGHWSDAMRKLKEMREAAAQQENTRPEPQPAPTAPAGGGMEPAAAQQENTRAPQGRETAGAGFDADAWQKARDDRVEASRAAGNTHLDTLPAYVESMRGKTIRGVHDQKVTGKILTVDNRGNVYVEWTDAYSQEKEGAVPMQMGRRKVMQTSLGPHDLKDYIVAPDAAPPKGREAAETGAGDRVQRAAEGGGQAQEPDALSLTPKQYHEVKLRDMADRNGVSMSEVRKMYDTEAGRAENTQEWVKAVMEAAKAGKPISRATLDKLEEVRPRAVGQLMHDYPYAKLPEGYQVPGARKVEAEESTARRANRAAAKAAPTGKALTPVEVKAEFQRQIDAVPRFDDGGPETITLKAGGSSVKLQNTARRVAEYMKALDTVKGGKTPKPVSKKTDTRPSGVVSWGSELSKRAPLKTITDMIDDFDAQAAVDFAAAQGIDLEVALKGDRKRLDWVRGLKPTPPT